VLNRKPTKVLRLSTSNPVSSHRLAAQSASEAGCWLKTVRSEESFCSYKGGSTMKKDTQQDENHREGNGKPPGLANT